MGQARRGGLPDVPVSTLLVDPDDSATLYAGTDVGIFVTYDAGATWNPISAPFASVHTVNLQIEFQGAAKILYAFTFVAASGA